MLNCLSSLSSFCPNVSRQPISDQRPLQTVTFPPPHPYHHSPPHWHIATPPPTVPAPNSRPEWRVPGGQGRRRWQRAPPPLPWQTLTGWPSGWPLWPSESGQRRRELFPRRQFVDLMAGDGTTDSAGDGLSSSGVFAGGGTLWYVPPWRRRRSHERKAPWSIGCFSVHNGVIFSRKLPKSWKMKLHLIILII